MTSMIGLNAAAEINFGRTQMMQRELAAQQDFTVSEIFARSLTPADDSVSCIGRRAAALPRWGGRA